MELEPISQNNMSQNGSPEHRFRIQYSRYFFCIHKIIKQDSLVLVCNWRRTIEGYFFENKKRLAEKNVQSFQA
jgi:hypothetical protein